MTPWLTVIGLGEDGLAGLSPLALEKLQAAELLVGGQRHLDMAGPHSAKMLVWETPLSRSLDAIAAHRGRSCVVLATGDPLWFGIGVSLVQRFTREEILLLPSLSAFQLAATELGWPLAHTVCITLHGRPLARLSRHLHSGARILALTDDGRGPAAIAKLLQDSGWGPSMITVLERWGGPHARRLDGIAGEWRTEICADLNIVAITARPGTGAAMWSPAPGLPDDAYRHDGQLTKRAIRAATLAALVPLPGECLWDVGAGSGSIAIEWLRAAPNTTAIAIEREPSRVESIRYNADRLGTPELTLVLGEAPAALDGLPSPNAIFIGGGISDPDLAAPCWDALLPGGRLVANAVTVEGEMALFTMVDRYGGALHRFSTATATPVGPFRGWRQAMPITQAILIKAR
jgi:precorrin-6Y C5,15-methyltransferase (decarboxylating)